MEERHSNFSQVLFNNVEKFYIPGDVVCCYTLTEKFVPRPKDWVGVFKVGWETTQEYYTFMWAPMPDDLNTESATQQKIQFKAYYLPKDEEHYQFCYVDEDGLVQGISIPFQFPPPDSEEDIMIVINKEKMDEMEQLREELYQENQELKDKYADLHEQLQRKQVALEATQRMNESLGQEVEQKASWEKQKASWEEQKASWEEQKASWESEMLHLKEYNQKITSEKENMEIRIEDLLIQLMYKYRGLVDFILKDEEKTKHWERLQKESNSQLSSSFTEQKQHWKELERIVEMLKENDAAVWKEEQELKARVVALQQKLININIDYNHLQQDNDILCGENRRLNTEICLLKNENKALRSSLANKDVSSNERAAEPEVPTPQVDAEPEAPTPQVDAEPEDPSAQADVEPEVPSAQADAEPEVPSAQADAEPEVPSAQADAEPEVPSPQADAEPEVPSAQADAEPEVPSPHVDAEPEVPSPQADAEPEVPPAQVDAEPEVPSPQADAEPEVSSPQAAAEPEVSSPQVDAEPEVSSPQAAAEPEVPSPQADAEPEVPSPQADAEPEVPSPQVDAESEAPSPQAAPESEVPSAQRAGSSNPLLWECDEDSYTGISGSSLYMDPSWEQLEPKDLYCPFCMKTYRATRRWVSWDNCPTLIPA
uniref:Calcium-binding and coiled-coil domain-containing protein 2 n=1 Tax=Rattus norvegicus TaxID=10116 RepID=A0ABK0LRL3_RAT